MKNASHHIRYAGSVHDARLPGHKRLSGRATAKMPVGMPSSFEENLDEDIVESLAKALLPRRHGAT